MFETTIIYKSESHKNGKYNRAREQPRRYELGSWCPLKIFANRARFFGSIKSGGGRNIENLRNKLIAGKNEHQTGY